MNAEDLVWWGVALLVGLALWLLIDDPFTQAMTGEVVTGALGFL